MTRPVDNTEISVLPRSDDGAAAIPIGHEDR